MPRTRLRLGVSSCLLGREVRYDGQHRRDAFVVEVLGAFVEWVPVCPELELGMGVPREPIRLVGTAAAPRLVAERSGKDHTAAMLRFAAARVRELEALGLHGYVTKKDSPSCGMVRVRVHGARGGPPRRDGVGMFARVLVDRIPLLPIEEEGRLSDPALRESFVERIFAYARWKAAAAGTRRRDLVRFHAAHELALIAHGPAAYRALGALVRGMGKGSIARTVERYGARFMAALAVPATRRGHASALRHAAARLADLLDAPDRRELAGAIARYARGHAPRAAPLALLRRHVRRHAGAREVAWLAGQTYLDPDPRELALRSDATQAGA
ncbi:MAG TPA: DUF523 and DUF1722 domain-containing protein [Anaeromyxobacter sp.]|nr:DUF523 and DUF1722 domain-containing protein [Anaeromyxobacter sp.]